MGWVFCVLCPVSRYHPGLTSEKFVIRICFKMTDGQIICYFQQWKKFIIWDDMRETRVRQVAYTTYICTPTNLLCTSSFWKPYKVLCTSIILLLLLSFIYVDSAFFIGMKIIIIIFLFHLLTWISRQRLIDPQVFLHWWTNYFFSTSFAVVSDNNLLLGTCKLVFTYENTPESIHRTYYEF